ncbi:MAG TPA: ABC transporter ATP-binding protein [Candidatus Dormibacteraeota bacterium]|jgi:putative ABC transport system ATP-binding protein|nr:ABC transporter ATP-binding protein [Candidatus Dormibacteraeota bacterium]
MTDIVAAPPPSSPSAGSGVVVADALRKTFHISRPPREVLHGVSLSVARGEFVALMGPSGCGKSTLLHILGGLEPPDTGTVWVEGQDLYARNDEALTAYRRDHMGFVFQLFNLIPTLTAAQNVALPLRLRRPAPSRSDIQDRVNALMVALDLHNMQGHGPEEISGGEQQRVAIARALAAQPTVLLADEPTGNLDFHTSREVMGLLARLCREEQQTTLLVTHDARTAAYADRVLVMRDGEVVAELTLEPEGGDPTAPRNVAPLITRLTELGL